MALRMTDGEIPQEGNYRKELYTHTTVVEHLRQWFIILRSK